MSTLIKRFGDTHTHLVKEYVDDEYQEKIENQANTVFVNTLPFTLYSIGAILAWSIPGFRSLLSLLVFLPLLIGIAFSQGWEKHYAPRPKPVILPRTVAAIIFLAIVQGLGIIYNVILIHESDIKLTAFIIGGVIAGGFIGGGLGGFSATRKMKKDRAGDIERLENDLED